MIKEGTYEHILLTYKTYLDNMLADEYCHGNFESCVFYYEEIAKVLLYMLKKQTLPQHISDWYKENISRYN